MENKIASKNSSKITTDNGVINSDLKFKILSILIESRDYDKITLNSLANQLNKGISTIKFHTDKLKDEGIIKSNFHITSKGYNLIKHLMRSHEFQVSNLRAHKLQIRFEEVDFMKGFNKYRQTFTSFYIRDTHQIGVKSELYDCKITFYPGKKVIMVTLPDIFAESKEEILDVINDLAGNIKQIIEEQIIGVKFKKMFVYSLVSNHVAIYDSIIAEKYFELDGKHFKNNKFELDQSHGVPELESINKDTAFEDISELLKFENIARENEELKKEIEDLKSKI